MPALKITAPGATTFLLEQIFVSAAELVQVCVSGNDNFLTVRAQITAENNSVNQVAAGLFGGNRQVWIEFCELEKLFRGVNNHKTMLLVIGLRFARSVRPFSVGVKKIFPGQFVAERKSIFGEIEGPAVGERRWLGSGAASE